VRADKSGQLKFRFFHILLTMQAIVACLAASSHGRRMHRDFRQSPDDSREGSLRSLAELLQTRTPAGAFQPAGTARGCRLTFKKPCASTSNSPMFARMAPARHKGVFMEEEKASVETPTETPPADSDEDCGCSIDNLGACSQEELELLYVDALWSYYEEKKQIITDEQYTELISELSWQGSGFPSLRRNEIAFVKAALAFAKGEAIVSDEKWDAMKAEIKATTGKRLEVTQFLLYARSLRETAETRNRLFEEMAKSGIGISVTATGASCTLSEVSNTLTPNVKDVFEMYLALSAVPTGLALIAWAIVALILDGPEGLISTAIPGIPIAGFVSYLLTSNLIKYVELAQPELLEGTCPCCESKVAYMSTSFNDRNPKVQCGNCKTDLEFNCDKREIGKAGGLNVIGAEDLESGTKGRWADDVLSKSLLNSISDNVLGAPNEKTQLGGPGKAVVQKIPKDMTALKYSLENLNDGLFAWLVLLGYAVVGEPFVIRARGKLISLHSQAITGFSNRYAIPARMRQQYVQTAKRNGEDLGFLVKPPKLFNDGLVGKQALSWLKSIGW